MITKTKTQANLKRQWSLIFGHGRQLHHTIRSYLDERLRQTQIAWIPSLIRPNRAWRFLWTGLVITFLACILGIIAINTSSSLLLLLLGLLLGAWLVSGVFSAINLAGITVTRDVSATSQVGEKLLITYIVTNRKRLFRSYSLVLEELGHLPMILPAGFVMSIRPGRQLRVTVEITCRRREVPYFQRGRRRCRTSQPRPNPSRFTQPTHIFYQRRLRPIQPADQGLRGILRLTGISILR